MTDNNGVQPLRASKLSLSAQAKEYLLDLIETGIYAPGMRLPSEAELANQLGISRPTLREALYNMEQEGAIVRKHGVGTFIAPSNALQLESGLEELESMLKLARRQGLELVCEGLDVREERADSEVARRLRIPLNTAVTCVRRVLVADGKPVCYMWDAVLASALPPEEVNGSFDGSVLDLLRGKSDLQVNQAVANIVALNAAPELATTLGLEPGQAVLLMEEIVYDDQGTPIEFSRNYFVPTFFRFRVIRR